MGQPTLDELFERRITYPDFEPKERLDRLIGLNPEKPHRCIMRIVPG